MPTEPKHKPIDFQPPDEIYEAAKLLHNYFTMQGMKNWKFMGIAARSFVEKEEATRAHPSPGAPAEWMPNLIAAIVKDLSGRRGIGDEWHNIDEEIQLKIIGAWHSLVLEHAPACDADKPAWRTMEDAPRDGYQLGGPRILGWSADWGTCFIVKWSPLRPFPHWTVDSGAVVESAPTHYMELPAPPAAAKEGE